MNFVTVQIILIPKPSQTFYLCLFCISLADCYSTLERYSNCPLRAKFIIIWSLDLLLLRGMCAIRARTCKSLHTFDFSKYLGISLRRDMIILVKFDNLV